MGIDIACALGKPVMTKVAKLPPEDTRMNVH
jgi:hypothetical protein